jgi:hypothetical protein
MNENYNIKLTPREEWLQKRTRDCSVALFRLSCKELEWEDFRAAAEVIATELLYAVTEWEKYYPKENKE